METVLFSDWDTWRARCALALCNADTNRRLTTFAWSRMDRFVRHYLSSSNMRSDDAYRCIPEPRECWHRFETHAMITETRQGKRYKEWLFARLTPDTSDAPIDVVQGGASLMIRDVARRYLQEEFAPRGSISMDRPISAEPDAPTLADLLPGEPDPVDAVAAREYERIAVAHAAAFMQAMTRRERLALLAKFKGISLAHPAIEEAAGCRKTVLSQTARDTVTGLALGLQQAYHDDGTDAVFTLSILVLRSLEKHLDRWKVSEKDLSVLFKKIEEDA